MQHKGRFIISLDFELLWGVRDKRSIESYGVNIRGVRQVIPALLQLFDHYKINATFATVGFLFCRNKQELEQNIPPVLPNYSLNKYSPYENKYIESIGDSESDDIYHYAHSLIKQIQQYPKQEIASHTFSHYYCLEKASLQSFEEDLKAAKKIAAFYNIDLKSIVFPRNQYSHEHITICKSSGFISYRGNELSPLYHPRANEEHNKLIRASRLFDSYWNLTGHHTFEHPKNTGGIVNIPSSRFLRPYSKQLSLFEKVRSLRIKNSLTYAAKKNQCYHLWWHPHNFGINTEKNIDFLEGILKHFSLLRDRFGIEAKSMKEIAEETLYGQ